MAYKNTIRPVYSKLLGNFIRKQLKELSILQNQIGYYDDFDGEVELLSETTVSQIIKGKRNMSFNASLAFQTTLNYPTSKQLFLQDDSFKIQLLSQLTTLITTDSTFDNTLLKHTLNKKINSYSKGNITDFIQSHKKLFCNSLSNFFPDFPEESSSYEIAEKLIDWLSEFACLLSQL
ncbi:MULTISPECIES: hypothetical protein [Streptococcus]|uniref:hypothetical protein n=1 Tax=Bacillota TaxID=1239 RepID=UPI0002177237|nr:hypothetical protein [Streptococcus thermophilus]EWM59849.1 hypothetical protein Y022_10495 [Streptococcus thermophilus TH1477]MBW7797121.1 hypothetical protein [Streptococcus thermophilus]MBW7802149.1 hypothetical protein [Streptococcus thermophilus]MBW7821746.1 hypothetical protein [Streptococcus thermophilus]MCE2067813.1 hypothetical protein [Streptococcus thermophilus]